MTRQAGSRQTDACSSTAWSMLREVCAHRNSLLQAAKVAKLDTKAEQAAAKGLQLDDDRAGSGESEDESPASGEDHNAQAASSPARDRGPAQKRAKKQLKAVWEPACRLPGSAAQSAHSVPVSTRMLARVEIGVYPASSTLHCSKPSMSLFPYRPSRQALVLCSKEQSAA